MRSAMRITSVSARKVRSGFSAIRAGGTSVVALTQTEPLNGPTENLGAKTGNCPAAWSVSAVEREQVE